MHRSVSKITGINLILVLDFLRTFLSYRISILYVEPYYAGQRGSLNLNLGHPLSTSLWATLSPLHFGPPSLKFTLGPPSLHFTLGHPLSTSLWTTLSLLHFGHPLSTSLWTTLSPLHFGLPSLHFTLGHPLTTQRSFCRREGSPKCGHGHVRMDVCQDMRGRPHLNQTPTAVNLWHVLGRSSLFDRWIARSHDLQLPDISGSSCS